MVIYREVALYALSMEVLGICGDAVTWGRATEAGDQPPYLALGVARLLGGFVEAAGVFFEEGADEVGLLGVDELGELDGAVSTGEDADDAAVCGDDGAAAVAGIGADV